MKRIYSLLILVVALFCYGNVFAAPVDVLTFPDYNDKGNTSYTDSWTATKDAKIWAISGFNNNNNGWALIKAGSKSVETTSTITTPACDVAVTDIVFTVDYTGNVTSATVEVLNGEEVVSTVDIYSQWKRGEVDAKVNGAAGNSYRLTITSTKSAANGTTAISQIALYESGQYTAPVLEEVTAESQKFWNFADFTLGDITETTIIDNLEMVAASNKKLSIDENPKSIDDINFTQRLKFGGTGTSEVRYIHFKVAPATKVTVYGMSANPGTTRVLNVDFGKFGLTAASLENDGNAIDKVEYEYTGETETDVYVYSTNSGFNIYGIKVATGKYLVNLSTPENGSLEADVDEAAEGATVTLTATPADGYQLDAIKVTYLDDTEEKEVTVAADNSFVMPASDVYVVATFKQKVKNEPGEFADTPLTKDMYKTWDGFDDYAKPTDAEPAWDDYTYGTTVEGGAVIYGNGSVFNTTYADITGTTVMRITGTPGITVRVMMNRQADNSLKEVQPIIGDDGKVEVDLSGYEYVHLNAIKMQWGNTGAVESVILNPSDAEEKVKNEPGEYEDTPLTKDMYKSWDGFDDYAKPTTADPAWDDYTWGTEAKAGVVIYGNGSVLNSTYADITGATVMRINGTPGVQLRILMNRQADNSLVEIQPNPTIGDEGYIDVDLSEYEYVHINAIKTGWGSATGAVESIILNPSEEPELITGENWTFDANPEDVITVTTQGYMRNVPEGSDQIWGMQSVTGWTFSEQDQSDPGFTGGIFAYGSTNLLNNKVSAPEDGPTDSPSALGLAAVWAGIAQYTQPITLDAGNYKFSYYVYNGANTGELQKNLFGFIADDGTEYLSDKMTFEVGEWALVEVPFTLEAETTGKVSVGFVGKGGSGASPHLFVDFIDLSPVTDEEIAEEELSDEIMEAQIKANDYVIGDDLFQYPESEIQPLKDAIAAAQAVIADDDASTEELKQALADLQAAEENFNPQYNEPVEGQAYTLSLTTTEGTFQLNIEGTANTIAEEGTPVYLVKQDDGTYAITPDNENYVVYAGGNNWTMSTSTTPYGFTFTALPDAGCSIQGKNGLYGTNSSDGNAAGSPVYGDKNTGNSNYIWNIEEATEDVLKGDVNKDNSVSVVDVTMTVEFALDQAEPDDYQKKAADMDNDEEITVADAAAIVDVIMDFDYDANDSGNGAKAREATTDYLTLNGNAVSLENSQSYVAFQMDITVNGTFNGAMLSSRANGHQLAYNQIGENTYRVLVLSNTNAAISGNSGELISFDVTGDFEILNTRFVTRNINSYFLNVGGEATGINGVRTLSDGAQGIYTLSGAKVNTLQKGVNIVRGADGKAVKVLVK